MKKSHVDLFQRHHERDVSKALLRLGEKIDPRALFPVLVPEAADLVLSDPYAFALATCLDRGTKAEIIWTIPYYMRAELGHLDPLRINQMSEREIAALLRRLPKQPRYLSDAPRTIKELTSLVVRQGGDASKLWKGKSASAVKQTFQSIYGVGPGIASMAVLLIEKGFGVQFDDLDRPTMDVKADVHVIRVLSRLGILATPTKGAAIAAARRMNPAYPGALDAPLWYIGRKWCHKYRPQCTACWMRDLCPNRAS